MAGILETVKRFFDEDDWVYEETISGLMLNFGGKSGEWRCFARIREPEGQFIFLSYAPFEIPAEQYLLVVDYLNRANFGMHIGNFELDFDSGTLQFRTSIDVQGDEESLSTWLVKHMVYQNVLSMERYLPGLIAVLEGSLSPEAAVNWVEAASL